MSALTEMGKLKIHMVSDPSILLPILKERLPISCLIYNQVVQHKKYTPEDLKFYSAGQEINSKTWIFSNNIRKDYGCNYTVSAPTPIANGDEPVPAEIKDCISNGGLIDWNDDSRDVMYFTQTPKALVPMIVDISVNEKGFMTEMHPGYLLYMDNQYALNLEISNDDPQVEVRRLDPSKGEEKYILKYWDWALPGSEIELPKCLARNGSGGVFLNGECVSTVYITGTGIFSALHTAKEHRNKGYAKLLMKHTFKEYAKEGCIPSSSVDLLNPRAKQFHEGLGMKVACYINALLMRKPKID